MSRPTSPAYKTRNWPAYNEALKRRGSLTIWFEPAMIWEAAPTGKRGRQPEYSDAAIQTCLTMKVLFGMALRQATGFVESLLRLIDLDWAVPNFSTLSRRQKTLKVTIPYRGSAGPLHLLIDSTGNHAHQLICATEPYHDLNRAGVSCRRHSRGIAIQVGGAYSRGGFAILTPCRITSFAFAFSD